MIKSKNNIKAGGKKLDKGDGDEKVGDLFEVMKIF